MSWSQIRTYFNGEIATALPDMKEWRDAFNIENVPRTLLDTYYHLSINAGTSTSAQDATVQDQMSVLLTVWRKGTSDMSLTQDELWDIAYCIRQAVINPRNVHIFDGDILAVENTQMRSEPIDLSNDNVVQIQLEFNVRMYFSVI